MPLARDAVLHPQYYVFFGRLHAEKALFLLLVLKVIGEVLEFLMGLAAGSSFDTMLELLDEALGFLEIITLYLAYRYKNHLVLIPAIIYEIFRAVVLLLAYCLTVAVMVSPTDHLKELFGHYENKKVEMIIVIITGLITSYYAFCVFTYLACYKYYSDLHTLKPRQANDERMTTEHLVEAAEPSTSNTSALSFRNPNYNDASPESELFPHSQGVGAMV